MIADPTVRNQLQNLSDGKYSQLDENLQRRITIFCNYTRVKKMSQQRGEPFKSVRGLTLKYHKISLIVSIRL